MTEQVRNALLLTCSCIPARQLLPPASLSAPLIAHMWLRAPRPWDSSRSIRCHQWDRKLVCAGLRWLTMEAYWPASMPCGTGLPAAGIACCEEPTESGTSVGCENKFFAGMACSLQRRGLKRSARMRLIKVRYPAETHQGGWCWYYQW